MPWILWWFSMFSYTAIEDTAWMSNYIPTVCGEVITFPYPKLNAGFMMASSNGNNFRVTGFLCMRGIGEGDIHMMRPLVLIFLIHDSDTSE